jgi:hypothetical protein
MEEITDSNGRVLFDNLAWFTKKLCSVMTLEVPLYVIICGVSQGGYTTGKEQERGDLGQSDYNHYTGTQTNRV